MQWISANNSRSDRISLAFVAVAVLLGVLALAKVASFLVGHARAEQVVARVQSSQDPNDLRELLKEAKETAAALKQENLFIRQPPRQHPVKQVDGILGSEALIANRWYKVGAKIGDAKIVEVNSTRVRIEWDGKETTFAPIAAVSAAPAAPAAKEPKKEGGPPPPKAPAEVQMVAAATPAPPLGDDPFAWLDAELSSKAKDRLLQHWNKLSDKEKQEAKEKWNKMSDQERKGAIREMERGIE